MSDPEDKDLGNLGEVIPAKRRSIPSLPSDPCDETLPVPKAHIYQPC